MKINGLGCALVDNLYSPVDFQSRAYKKWSRESGLPAGLITGGLVFAEDLEKASGTEYRKILAELTRGVSVPEKNLGGPCLAAQIHMSQMLYGKENFHLAFYGARGDDENGRYLMEKTGLFSIDTREYRISHGQTPFTDVLCDPVGHNGNSERTFINYIGAAGNLTGADIPESFFQAEFLIYGGTALTPGLHDDLSLLLKKGKTAGAFNFVNTVYDFRNQFRSPQTPWPLVDHEEDFTLIDLLVLDNEEALRISGTADKTSALKFFAQKGVKSVLITHGSDNIACYSRGNFYSEKGTFSIPVSQKAGRLIKEASSLGDTTGCGDNFTGGVYASTALQYKNSDKNPSLKTAAAWGVVSGGLAGLYKGGVYYETFPGEKQEKLEELFRDYESQTGETYE